MVVSASCAIEENSLFRILWPACSIWCTSESLQLSACFLPPSVCESINTVLGSKKLTEHLCDSMQKIHQCSLTPIS